jgi:small subunit ribosomal protein S18
MSQQNKSIFQKKNLKSKKSSMLKAWKVEYIDFKNIRLLKRFISVFERILPRRYTGNSSKHQKMVAQAIKRARFMGLLPYTNQHDPVESSRKY